MYGYACGETPELMPLGISLAHRLMLRQSELLKSNSLPWLRPDAKCQVTVRYVDSVPVGVTNVVLSTQHADGISQGEIKEQVINLVIDHVIPPGLRSAQTVYMVNPTSRFVTGGPQADTGLTGRKIIADTYGASCPHGGGAFSGKDPSKVDRSAAYMARYIAKNIVAAGLAGRCTVQLAYAIGVADPVSLMIDLHGTGSVEEAVLVKEVPRLFRLDPAGIIETLNLRRPIYRQTAAYGHFGRELPDFTWERTDKAEALRELIR
jgi:S-adenosylmethionine synthetase